MDHIGCREGREGYHLWRDKDEKGCDDGTRTPHHIS